MPKVKVISGPAKVRTLGTFLAELLVREEFLSFPVASDGEVNHKVRNIVIFDKFCLPERFPLLQCKGSFAEPWFSPPWPTHTQKTWFPPGESPRAGATTHYIVFLLLASKSSTSDNHRLLSCGFFPFLANTKKRSETAATARIPQRGKGETERHQGFALFPHKKVGVPKGGGKSGGNYAHSHHALKVTHDWRASLSTVIVNWAIVATTLVTIDRKRAGIHTFVYEATPVSNVNWAIVANNNVIRDTTIGT